MQTSEHGFDREAIHQNSGELILVDNKALQEPNNFVYDSSALTKNFRSSVSSAIAQIRSAGDFLHKAENYLSLVHCVSFFQDHTTLHRWLPAILTHLRK